MTPSDRLALADIVRAGIAAVEQTAQAATPGPWRVPSPIEPGWTAVWSGRWWNELTARASRTDAVHIAVHDPASVLAACARARRDLDRALAGADRAEEGLERHVERAQPLNGLWAIRACRQCGEHYPCPDAARYAAALADSLAALADLDTTYGGQP